MCDVRVQVDCTFGWISVRALIFHLILSLLGAGFLCIIYSLIVALHMRSYVYQMTYNIFIVVVKRMLGLKTGMFSAATSNNQILRLLSKCTEIRIWITKKKGGIAETAIEEVALFTGNNDLIEFVCLCNHAYFMKICCWNEKYCKFSPREMNHALWNWPILPISFARNVFLSYSGYLFGISSGTFKDRAFVFFQVKMKGLLGLIYIKYIGNIQIELNRSRLGSKLEV